MLLASPDAVDGLCAPSAQSIQTFFFNDIWLSRTFEDRLLRRRQELPEPVRNFFAAKLHDASLICEIARKDARVDSENDANFLPEGDR